MFADYASHSNFDVVMDIKQPFKLSHGLWSLLSSNYSEQNLDLTYEDWSCIQTFILNYWKFMDDSSALATIFRRYCSFVFIEARSGYFDEDEHPLCSRCSISILGPVVTIAQGEKKEEFCSLCAIHL